MRVGIQLPEIERVVRWHEVERLARLVETAGFDSVWVGDHLIYDHNGERVGPWEAWSQLAAIAATTERVQLGPLVGALPFHHPSILAKMASTIDEISGGRLILGVGAGWNEDEFTAFGIPHEDRVSRFEEQFEIMRRLLTGERVDFEGRFYRLVGAELLPKALGGRPPIMIGSSGRRMLSISLPHADMWNAWFAHFGNDPDELVQLIRTVERACSEVGRDPDTLEKTAAVLLQFGDEPKRRGSVNPILGTPGEMASRLRRFRDIGLSHVQLILDPIDSTTVVKAAEVREAM